MKKSFLFLSIFVFQVLIVSSAFAAAIPIDNYSFENPQLNVGTGWRGDGAGEWTQGVSIPGWTSTDTGMSGVITGYGTAADGNNAAWVQGINSISQVLTATLQPDTDYTLSVSVGHRSSWPLAPEIQLLAGGNILAEDVLTGAELPADGTFSIFTLTYQSGPSVFPGQNLEINLMNLNGGQPHFDDVTLNDGTGNSTNNVVPEPSTILLLSLGSGLMALRRDRRKKKAKL
jgi:hypothetical protein